MFVINSLMTQDPGVVIACVIFLLVFTAILTCVRVTRRFRDLRLYDDSDLSSREKTANAKVDGTVDDHINLDNVSLQKIRQDITYGVV